MRKLRTSLPILLLALLVVAASSAQEQAPRDPDRPWIASADSLARLGQLDDALLLYRRLGRAHADDVGLWLRIAVAELQRGEGPAALEAAHRARALDPEDPEPALVLAQVQLQTSGPERALATLEEALAKHPEDDQLLESVASFAVGMGDRAKAAGAMYQLIRLHPERHGYRFDLARLLTNSNELAQAADVLQEALRAGADAATCHAMLGKCALLAGDAEAARGSFDRALAIGPSAEAFGGLGALAFVEGKPAAAAEHFRRALQLAPDDADLYFNLGNALAQLERAEEAENAYRQSLRLDPYAAGTHLNLGILQLARFRPEAARRSLKRAVELEPERPDAHLHLARIHAALYEHAAAQREYRLYLERIDDPKEHTRIQAVIANLAEAERNSAAARERGEIHVLQMMLATREEAAMLMDRARAGEDFYALAEQFSLARDRAGVDAGFVDPNELAPIFRDALLALQPRQVSPIVQGPNGWYIFQRVE